MTSATCKRAIASISEQRMASREDEPMSDHVKQTFAISCISQMSNKALQLCHTDLKSVQAE